MGMDAIGVCAAAGLCGNAVLSGLLGELFRWKALRFERRIAAHRSLPVAAVVPELVSTPLSVRLRDVSLRGRLTSTVRSRRTDDHATHSASGVAGIRGRNSRRTDPSRTTGIAEQVFV